MNSMDHPDITICKVLACRCGTFIRIDDCTLNWTIDSKLDEHFKTKRHLTYINKINLISDVDPVSNTKIICPCGSMITNTRNCLLGHSKTKKHKAYVERNSII